MSAVVSKEGARDRRVFPRIKANCPVHYFTRVGGAWCEAELEDYSANGILIRCDETLLQDTKITIQIMRNAKVTVPAMAASAVVVRCDLDENHRYRVACKLTRVRREDNPRENRLRPGMV